MNIRKSHLAGAVVAAAALFAGAAGAQPFEQSVNDALAKDGAVVSKIPAQKALASQENADLIDDQFQLVEMADHGGHGGQHGGQQGGGQRGGGEHRGPGHEQPGRGGGDHRGPGHEQPGRGGNDHRGDNDHRGPGHEQPGRCGNDHRGPGREHPEHRMPTHRPDHRPDRDWNRWHGHPGWGGHFRDRWTWDPYGRPLWLGWIIWSGAGSCRNYYGPLRVQCHADCGAEASAGIANCNVYAPGDASCVALVNKTQIFCKESCEARYYDYWRTCTF